MIGSFLAAALLSMALTSALGLLVQRWMTYELLAVDGGIGAWSFAAAVLIGMGLATAVLVGLPCYVLARSLLLAGTPRAFLFCILSATLTTILYRALAPLGTTALDHALIPALALVFFNVLYAISLRTQTRPQWPSPPA